jgi:hypothetical protein
MEFIKRLEIALSHKHCTQQAFGKIANFVVNTRLHFARNFIFDSK